MRKSLKTRQLLKQPDQASLKTTVTNSKARISLIMMPSFRSDIISALTRDVYNG